MKSLQRGEFDQLIEAAPRYIWRKSLVNREVLALVLLHDLALRCHEMVNLTIESFDLESKTVTVDGKGSRWAVGKKRCVLPVSERILEHLERHEYENHLITTSTGMPVDASQYRRLLPVLGQQILGKHVHPHMLRHSRITELALDKKVDILIVMKFARHESVSTTMKYLHFREDWMDEIVHAL